MKRITLKLKGGKHYIEDAFKVILYLYSPFLFRLIDFEAEPTGIIGASTIYTVKGG